MSPSPNQAPLDALLGPPLDRSAGFEETLRRIERAGVVGMGGAGYPTARKLREAKASGADTVVGNGMASEPGAGADRALLRQHFAEVAEGLRVVGDCLGAARTVIAVPPGSGLPAPAVEARPGLPEGDEKRLTAHVLGRAVPAGGRPTDIGAVVFNVATLFAVFEAVRLGRPLRRRLVTVGDEERWLRIGTPLAELGLAPPLRIGGVFAGRPAPVGAVVEATTFCVSSAPAESPLPCIRCGWCVPACPEGLEPAALHAAFEHDTADAAVFDCIECGACAAACPSAIDLVNEFRASKARLRDEQARHERAAAAKRRFDARQRRLERRAQRQAEERAERMQRRRSQRAW